MRRRDFLKAAGTSMLSGLLYGCSSPFTHQSKQRPPNFVVIFTDDQGYGDVGCYGGKGFTTPNLDEMAAEGMRFTDFYVSAPACTPSRASLMTGCYPQRVGLPWVLMPKDRHGISSEEETLPELLKRRGYATACFGKWHLGHYEPFYPTEHGFDEFWGLPYSNDMRPARWRAYPHWREGFLDYPDLVMLHNDEIVAVDPDQTKLTSFYTTKTLEFIRKHKDRPFFVYLAHSMPHVPLAVSNKFEGAAEIGLYGDVMMEIDWSVGQVLATLKKFDLDDNTLVIFTSDNGPWLVYGNHAGSARPLREGKGTCFEGGMRVPCIMRQPGKIPAGVTCAEPVTSMDILPTLVNLAGAPMPEKKIDGKDIRAIIHGESGAKSPHEAIFYYLNEQLQAVRSGRWKLHVPHRFNDIQEPGKDGMPGKQGPEKIELALYDLHDDIAEEKNLADGHPDIVKRLMGYIEDMRQRLGDKLTKTEGTEIRPPGRV